MQLQTASPFESSETFLAKVFLMHIVALVASMFHKNFIVWIWLIAIDAPETVEIGGFVLGMFEFHVHD